VVLAVFAIICGLMLILFGSWSSKSHSDERADDLARLNQVVLKQVAATQRSLGQVEQALEASNFGAAGKQIQVAQQHLAVILFQMKQMKKPSK